MASELVINTNRVQKFTDDLEAQKNILFTCTQLFTTISKRFTSLQDFLSQKSQSLYFRIQALESIFRGTLESLNRRESSIHERESAVVGRIEQKEAALAQFEKPLSGNEELSETLKSFSRKMDSSGLLKFMISKRKESVTPFDCCLWNSGNIQRPWLFQKELYGFGSETLGRKLLGVFLLK